MATTDLIGTTERAVHQPTMSAADAAAHEAASYVRPAPTAPLPPAAVSAMQRLEVALVRYPSASKTYSMLAASTAWMASAEFDRMLCAADEIGHCRQQLGEAAP